MYLSKGSGLSAKCMTICLSWLMSIWTVLKLVRWLLGSKRRGKQSLENIYLTLVDSRPLKSNYRLELNAAPDNTKTKEDIRRELDQLMERMTELKMKVDKIIPNYKQGHGGFGWLNAQEWFDLVGMHFRHHLRQKYELDEAWVKHGDGSVAPSE
jgi:hypothetical protein